MTKLLVFSLFLSLFTFSVLVCRVAASDAELAASTINQTEKVASSAYAAVLDAEQVGANVSDLLTKFNEAGELLAEAHTALKLGNFDEAVLLANLCQGISEEVKDEADDLRVKAYDSRVMSSWIAVIGSLVGVVAVVVGSFWSWRVFKRRYYRRILKMKPEVAEDES